MLTQTIAILLDAYRELNAKKLFWITLAISGLIVGAFFCVGINEQGVSVFGFPIPAFINTGVISPDTFYKILFTEIGVPIWLTWGAIILALVSTAGSIPDALAAGGVELTLSKPISRARLFLTRYVGSLLFVALQAAVFSVAVFLLIGIRGKAWEPIVFITIPLVTLQFSFIYCVCALAGLLTRSTIAALLCALGFWMLIFAAHLTETIYLQAKVGAERRVVSHEAKVDETRRALEALTAPSDPSGVESGAPPRGRGVLGALADSAREQLLNAEPSETTAEERLRAELTRHEGLLDAARKRYSSYRTGHRIVLAVKTALPKTTETSQLLSRSLLSLSDLRRLQNPDNLEMYATQGDSEETDDAVARFRDIQAVAETTQGIVRARSPWWVLGTSALFEALILAIAVRHFSRRDF